MFLGWLPIFYFSNLDFAKSTFLLTWLLINKKIFDNVLVEEKYRVA